MSSNNTYHGENYKNTDGTMGGLYEYGYTRGFDEATNGCSSDDNWSYLPMTTPSGNQGYADGVKDGGGFNINGEANINQFVIDSVETYRTHDSCIVC